MGSTTDNAKVSDTVAHGVMRFDGFELDIAQRQLRRRGRPVELGSRYFDALVLLVGEAGALVPKDRFMDEIWRGIPVTDEALTQCIRTLRRALGDDAAAPRYIQTVPKHGYRFIAEVDRAMPTAVQAARPADRSPLALPGRMAGAATLAGGGAGALGGLFYGITASTGSGSTVLALTVLIATLGVLGGAGVGLGMAGALAWRGRADAAMVPGAAIGGMFAGALGSTLGRDGVGLITGAHLGPVTGVLEGLILGAACGGAALAVRSSGGRWLAAAAAAGLGAAAGLAIHASGGRLLGGTLATLQGGLGTARLELGNLGALLGDAGFGSSAQLVTGMAEGAVFTLALAIAAACVLRR